MAARLAARLKSEAKIDIVVPVEANSVFVRMNNELAKGLQERGWDFYNFIEADIHRLMCSWSVTEEAIADFMADVVALKT
jgi:threonine aldolase